MNTNLNDFAKWQSENPAARSFEIKMEPARHGKQASLSAWVYDYDLMIGQRVQSVEEINLVAHREKEEREKLAELKAKYESTQ